MPYVIRQEHCSACHRCRTGCPVQAIRFQNAKYWIDPEKCISCGRCVKVCHNGAISNPERPAKKMAPHDKIVKTCDVVVLGAGGAGIVAANRAQDAGKSVILVEKMHEVGGSSWYAGGFRVHWCKESAALGLEDHRAEKFVEFMERTENRVDPELLQRMFTANEEFADWLIDSHNMLEDYQIVQGHMGPGPTVTMFEARRPWKDASLRIDRMIGPGEIGSYMAEHMQEDFLKGGGTLLLKTSAYQLLTDETGAICGVLCRDEGGEIELHCKAVVVATGAFTRNKELMDKFQPLFYDDEGKEKIHIFTGVGSTGDGITMCDALGADIDYVNRRVNMFGPMRHPYPCASMAVYQNHDGFEIGSQGNLFHGRMGIEVSDLVNDPKRHGWKIVDDAICVAAIAEAMQEPPQSQEMDLPKFQANWREVFAEEALDRAIVIADSIPELAEKLEIDPVQLQKTVDEYNLGTEKPLVFPPDFPEFMKPRHAPMKVQTAPYYAIKMKIFHENSIGGMTIDKNASVLRQGQPIPGLFAAGDTTRGIMVSGDVGVDYLEGVFSSLTMAYNEGFIAGTEAANYCG